MMWVDAAGFDGKYQVNENGDIRNKKTGKKKKPERKSGYLYLVHETTCKGKRIRTRRQMGRVMWESFNGPAIGLVIDHINRDPCDNRLCNIRSITQAENRINSKTRVDSKHSHYVGVIDSGGSTRGSRERYRARVKKDGRIRVGPVRRCETAAAIDRDRLAIEVFGPDVVSLNFPMLFGRATEPAALA